MKRTLRDAAILAIAMVIFALAVMTQVKAAEQTRIYGPDGRSLGTATPQGDGTVRYRDAGGNSLGTSTTMPGAGSTTTYYGPGGNVTGKAAGPAGGPFGGTRR
jgi:hypothetical protein